MIQPVFERATFTFIGGAPKIYTQPSDGSGKEINVHFCPDCGTKLALIFERWPDKIGLYIGTLDDPNSVSIEQDSCKHIFVSEARPGTILPPGVKVFHRHAAESDGTAIEPVIHTAPFVT